MPRINDWIHELRTEATRLLLASNELDDLAAEYVAGGYDATKIAAALEGTSETVTAAEIVSIIGSTIPAQAALLAAGHRDNLTKVRVTLNE